MRENVTGITQRSCSEQHPRSQRQYKGRYHRDAPSGETLFAKANHLIETFTVFFGRNSHEQIYTIERAPNDIRPVRSVPETTHSEGNHDRQYPPRKTCPAAAHRYVQIITEPRRKRNVPAMPELRNRPR